MGYAALALKKKSTTDYSTLSEKFDHLIDMTPSNIHTFTPTFQQGMHASYTSFSSIVYS